MISYMYDSINPHNIPSDLEEGNGIAGYIDGKISRWLPSEWAFFEKPATKKFNIVKISVLANPIALVFDYENGNASVGNISHAINARIQAGLKSVIYCSLSNASFIRTHFQSSIDDGWVHMWIADYISGPAVAVSFLKNNHCAAWQYKSETYDTSFVDTDKFPYWNTYSNPVPVSNFTLSGVKYNIMES